MKNAHLVLPEEERIEYLPPKWCFGLLALMFVAFLTLGILIVNHWSEKVDDLQGRLWSAQTHVDELERENSILSIQNENLSKENATLKCEAYFYGE